jgi:hypothetical protein
MIVEEPRVPHQPIPVRSRTPEGLDPGWESDRDRIQRNGTKRKWYTESRSYPSTNQEAWFCSDLPTGVRSPRFTIAIYSNF